MNRFKVGDRVKISDRAPIPEKYASLTGIVAEYRPSAFDVAVWVDGQDRNDGPLLYFDRELESLEKDGLIAQLRAIQESLLALHGSVGLAIGMVEKEVK